MRNEYKCQELKIMKTSFEIENNNRLYRSKRVCVPKHVYRYMCIGIDTEGLRMTRYTTSLHH